MLQRIQTVWLFLTAACAFLTLKFSTYSGTNKRLESPGFLTGTETISMMALTIAVGVIALITIFLYNNRKLQIRLTIVAILLELVLLYLYYREIELYVGKGAISITALLHVAVILFLLMAAKGINNDEKLIKDSNRLR